MVWVWLSFAAFAALIIGLVVWDVTHRRRADKTLRGLVRPHLAEQACRGCGAAGFGGWDGRFHGVSACLDYLPQYRGPVVCRELWLSCSACGRPSVFWVRSDGLLTDVSGLFVKDPA